MRKKIILIGKSCSGKDHLFRELVKKGFSPGIKWTTRPMRKFEKQNIEYNFVNYDVFTDALDADEFLVHQSFYVTPMDDVPTTWYYGMTINEFENKELFIMTPGEVNIVPKNILKDCLVIYLDIDRNIREQRMCKREDKNDSIKRRLDSDDIDFKDFEYYDLKISNPNFNIEDILEDIKLEENKKTH